MVSEPKLGNHSFRLVWAFLKEDVRVTIEDDVELFADVSLREHSCLVRNGLVLEHVNELLAPDDVELAEKPIAMEALKEVICLQLGALSQRGPYEIYCFSCGVGVEGGSLTNHSLQCYHKSG
eukprot:CAMPEP_0114568612 /NCGR_PEP_ID=MMETSP0114-20121206/16157_1 /TAXON_ID=31324 /ORGANISM="Goniomonas sp, Strain m" /LENGTH=121 /DNA_ID=CAMNT_0001755379 /DNA_START=276 /DNA_END=638 /DNA_ORIENTATION=+